MSLRSARAKVCCFLVGMALAPSGCGLLWSFDGYAGDGARDGGHESATKSIDATRETSASHDGAVDHAADRATPVDAARDAPAPHDGPSDVAPPDAPPKDATEGGECAEGGCSPCDGPCQPVTIDPGSNEGISAIALDDTTVYWTALYGHAVGAALKDGTSHTTLTESAAYFTSIAVGGGMAYFGSTSGFIASCPTTGCPANGVPKIEGIDGGDVEGVSVFGSYLFGIAEHAQGGPAVLSSTIDGGSFAVTPSAGGERLTSIEATDAGLFWSTVGGVYACAAGRCDAGLVTETTSASVALAVNPAGDVFWLTLDGHVASCPHGKVITGGCGSPVMVTTNPISGAAQLAVDDTYVYVSAYGTIADGGASRGDGTIVRCPQTSCGSPMVLASHEDAPGPIAVDATFIYWGDTNDACAGGSTTCPIRKLQKP